MDENNNDGLAAMAGDRPAPPRVRFARYNNDPRLSEDEAFILEKTALRCLEIMMNAAIRQGGGVRLYTSADEMAAAAHEQAEAMIEARRSVIRRRWARHRSEEERP